MTEQNTEAPWRRVSEVRLELGAASIGTLPLLLRLDDYELETAASFVLNDPVDELIDLHKFLGEVASGFRRTCLWVEPTGYALDIQHLSETECLVAIRYDDAFVPPMAGHAMLTVNRSIVPTERMRRTIGEALRALFARPRKPNQRDDLESLRAKWQRVGGKIEAP